MHNQHQVQNQGWDKDQNQSWDKGQNQGWQIVGHEHRQSSMGQIQMGPCTYAGQQRWSQAFEQDRQNIRNHDRGVGGWSPNVWDSHVGGIGGFGVMDGMNGIGGTYMGGMGWIVPQVGWMEYPPDIRHPPWCGSVQFESRLGSGMFGEVWRAVYKGGSVAAKVEAIPKTEPMTKT